MNIATVAALSCAISISSAAASSGRSTAAAPLKVTSTLDGKTVLPHRVRWIAQTNAPGSEIAKVQFIIDGKLRWVETKRPYVYGDNSDWLVTTWLKPGVHHFTVRAITRAGRKAARTSTARVLPAPAPPTELANTQWKRLLKNQGELGSPAGTWTIRVTPAGWKIDDPKGGTNFVDVAYLSGGLLELRGGIWTRPRSTHEGNGWCEDTNQAVRYHWAITSGKLTLTLAGPKRCGDQATVLSDAGDPGSAPRSANWTHTP